MNHTQSGASRKRHEDSRLVMTVPESSVPKFFGLIQGGFELQAVAGDSIKSFLCQQVGLSEDYFEERIQTLFLDSKPVDDGSRAVIQDGSRLALSAAMPGVAGALFRKGGRYGAMRSGISYRSQKIASSETSGWVTVKLFNLVLRELGPFFLARGVWIDAVRVRGFFKLPPEGLLSGGVRAEKDGVGIEASALAGVSWPEGKIFLKILSN